MSVLRIGRGVMVVVGGACLALSVACGGDGAGDESAADTAGTPTMGAATDTGAAATGGTAGAGGMGDPQILAQMSVANGAEIAAGQAAQQKATNAEVKNFARDMVTEHQMMQAQTDSLVTRAGISPQASQPDTLQQKLDQDRQHLQGMAAGAEFDRMYMDMQVRDHEATLNLLNSARGAAQNAELRTLIDQALPRVQQHLERARQIRTSLGGA